MENPKLRPIRLRNLVKHVQGLPTNVVGNGGGDRWDQGDWRYCLAGHAVKRYGTARQVALLEDDELEADDVAEKLLGLTPKEGAALWYEARRSVEARMNEILAGDYR